MIGGALKGAGRVAVHGSPDQPRGNDGKWVPGTGSMPRGFDPDRSPKRSVDLVRWHTRSWSDSMGLRPRANRPGEVAKARSDLAKSIKMKNISERVHLLRVIFIIKPG